MLRTLAILLLTASSSVADTSTRVGLSATAGTAALPIEHPGIIGTELTLSHWAGPIGIAAEGSVIMLTDTAREGAASIGVSGRLRLAHGHGAFRALDGSVSPVDYGLNVEAVIQREWWDLEREMQPRTSHVRYGVGISTFFGGAHRSRLVQFRASARLLFTPAALRDTSARMLGASDSPAEPEVGIVFALGTELGAVH